MLRFILKRILLMIPTVLGVVVLVFTIIWFAPGDVVGALATDQTTEQEMEELRRNLGLDRSFGVQLGSYLWDVVTKLDLGTSLVNKTNIAQDVIARYPNSIRIAFGGMAIAIVIGIPLGAYAALHRGKAGDAIASTFALFGVSTPGFWAALMLVIVFSYHLKIFPSFGHQTWMHWVLPTFAASLTGIGRLTRQTRSSVLEVIRSDFVVMAKAKGLPPRKVMWRHIVPNSLMPLITVAGMNFGTMLGGGLIIERVFSIPGVGGYLVDNVTVRDFKAVQGGVIMTALVFCTVILLCDILMAFIDPRIKARYAGNVRRRKKDA